MLQRSGVPLSVLRRRSESPASAAVTIGVFGTAFLTDCGISAYEKWDRRADRANLMFLMGTRDVLVLYPLVRPFMVRQVEQLDAAHAFMAPAYAGGRQRVRWTDEQRAAWEVLRTRFHNVAA